MANKIKITFLGTGSSVPTENRNHTSVLLKYKEHNLLFDCGEGTQRQFRKSKENLMKINKIFISHWHGDHTLGLPGLLQTMAMSGYNKTLEIHGPKETKKRINDIIKTHMAHYLKMSKEEGYNFKIKSYEHTEEKIIDTEDFSIFCFPLLHPVPTIGFVFEIKDKLRINKTKLNKLKIPNTPLLKDLTQGKDITINNKKIKSKDLTYKEFGKKISYVLDTGYDLSITKKIKDSDILIIESTYSSDEEDAANKRNHLTSKQAAKIAQKSKVKELFLIHLSQRYDKISKVLKKEAKEEYSGKITIPNDFDSIEI